MDSARSYWQRVPFGLRVFVVSLKTGNLDLFLFPQPLKKIAVVLLFSNCWHVDLSTTYDVWLSIWERKKEREVDDDRVAKELSCAIYRFYPSVIDVCVWAYLGIELLKIDLDMLGIMFHNICNESVLRVEEAQPNERAERKRGGERDGFLCIFKRKILKLICEKTLFSFTRSHKFFLPPLVWNITKEMGVCLTPTGFLGMFFCTLRIFPQ